jgi:excisionase family DNA binding protein
MTDTLHKGSGSAPMPLKANLNLATAPPMLTPQNAWRILCRRTGAQISRATFYRWVSEGKLLSVRLGAHIHIPWPALDQLIQRCLEGERW